MKAFRYIRPRDCAQAAEALRGASNALLHAGGTDLLGRMKERVDEPDALVALLDAKGMQAIRIEEDGAITIGARATLAAIAEAPAVLKFLPSLAQAAGHAASPQLRRRATLGGNIAQHTRCGYYRMESFPCLKRGAESCPVRAEGAVQDNAGIFGNGVCASAHPSSVAPVLGALDAEILVRGPKAERVILFEDFWADPKRGRAGDTRLGPTDVIRAVRFPARDERQHVGNAEVRQKKAFDWALASCSVRYEMENDKITDVRVWFGSLAPAPWRAIKAEAVLKGGACSDEAAAKAAAAALADATPLPGSTYKVQLAKVVLKRALAAARKGA